MSHLIDNISPDFLKFILVTLFSLLIGLEQRRQHQGEQDEQTFGADRTFTFVGILGFILYLIEPDTLIPFLIGGIVLTVFLGIFYLKKIEFQKRYGITSLLVVLIVYSLGPLLYIKPIWFSILVVSTLLVLVELKSSFKLLTARFDNDEFIILAKFLIMAGIVLPLLSNNIISQEIPISPYKIWLSVVVISGISYLSYLIQKFLFPSNGIIITGLLGGMYSSTATTVVLARKSKKSNVGINLVASSIILATGVMFIRVLLLAFIFNTSVAKALSVPIILLSLLTFIVSWVIYKFGNKGIDSNLSKNKTRNPLEFKTALLFAALFIIFSLLTKYVMVKYGVKGLNLLSLFVGVTDIDPFLLSLFTGKFHIALGILVKATLIAITSNNLLKLGYTLFLSDKSLYKTMTIGFSVIIVATVILIFIL